MPFLFNYYTLSLVLGGFIALISGLVVYTRNTRELTNNAWLLLNVSSAIWSFGYFTMISTPDKNVAYVSNLILHQGAILIPLFYFLFVLAITQSFNKHSNEFLIAGIVAVIFSYLNPTSEFVVTVLPKFIFNYTPEAGPFYIYFTAYFFILTIYSLLILWKFIRSHASNESLALKFVLGASIAGFLGGGSVFFLTFNIQIPPIPIMFFSLYPIIITYAILKHHLFDVRVIVTELLVFTTWIFLLVRIILTTTFVDRLVDGTLLTILIVVGTLLIRSVIKEVKNREEIEKLAKQLQEMNTNLEDINQAKSDFLSIASHQLKTPLSIIKGYVSMAMEGMFGRMNRELHTQMNKVYISNERLISLVEDLLNLSRIEDGRMKYDWEVADMVSIVNSVTEEMRDTIKKKKLTLHYKKVKEEICACVDVNKIRNVIFNIVDNAIKYTDEGSITISVEQKNKKICILVQDTGRGISSDNISKLFNKFTRAENTRGSRNTRVSGFGLGLYVTRLITEAHKGSISVTSEGEGMGSTFIIELPSHDASKITKISQQQIGIPTDKFVLDFIVDDHNILHITFSGLLTKSDLETCKAKIYQIRSLTKEIYTKTGASVNELVDLSGLQSNFDVGGLKILADAFELDKEENLPIRIAAFGASNTIALAAKLLKRTTNHSALNIFDTKEEALAWLKKNT